MREVNIQHSTNIKQDSNGRRNEYMPSRALVHLLHTLIHENANKHIDGYDMSVDDLTTDEHKLILSHLISADDYNYICSSYVRVQEELKENKKFIQTLIDQELEFIYYQDIYHCGGKVNKHGDNGENWVIRK